MNPNFRRKKPRFGVPQTWGSTWKQPVEGPNSFRFIEEAKDGKVVKIIRCCHKDLQVQVDFETKVPCEKYLVILLINPFPFGRSP